MFRLEKAVEKNKHHIVTYKIYCPTIESQQRNNC